MLQFAYPNTVPDMAAYDTIRIHTAWGRRAGTDPATRPAPNFVTASKEGYLTKRGHVVKNWKLRWFVLAKDRLAYYARRGDAVPRGEIELNTVVAVAPEPAPDRRFCFRVDCVPARGKTVAYLIQAAGDAEVAAWVDVIDWARVRAGAGRRGRCRTGAHGAAHRRRNKLR